MKETVDYEEKELLVKLQQRDPNALNYLYNNYSRPLYCILCKMVKCEQTSESLLHNVFVNVYKNIEQYNAARGKLFTWLINMTRNEAVDFLQKKNTFETIDENKSLIETRNLARGIFPDQIQRIDVTRLLHLLPKKEKAIMILITMGYTCLQVSQIVNLPQETIKSKIRLSYKQLIKHLS